MFVIMTVVYVYVVGVMLVCIFAHSDVELHSWSLIVMLSCIHSAHSDVELHIHSAHSDVELLIVMLSFTHSDVGLPIVMLGSFAFTHSDVGLHTCIGGGHTHSDVGFICILACVHDLLMVMCDVALMCLSDFSLLLSYILLFVIRDSPFCLRVASHVGNLQVLVAEGILPSRVGSCRRSGL